MRTAVVVGAGVAGLAAAGALARAGWRVTLIERGERLRGTGGAQILHPNGVAALRALDLPVGDLAFAAPPGGVRRPDGRVLVEPAGPVESPAPNGTAVRPEPVVPENHTGLGSPVRATALTANGTPVVLHADDLHDLLMAALGDKIEIRTGTEVTGITTSGAGLAGRDRRQTHLHRRPGRGRRRGR